MQKLTERAPARTAALILLTGLAALAVYTLASGAVIDRAAVLDWDRDVVQDFYEARTPARVDAFEVVTKLGSEALWALSFLVGGVFIWRRRWGRLAAWTLAMSVGKLANIWLKDWFERPRPAFADLPVVESSYGYPSGHAMLSLIAYGMLAYFAWRAGRWGRIGLVVGALALIGLIGLSRLVLSVHFPSDVIGGYVAGGLWLATCIAVGEALRRLPARDAA